MSGPFTPPTRAEIAQIRAEIAAHHAKKPRFRIHRLPDMATPGHTWALWPWILKDREHPERLQRFATHGEAIDAADALARGEASA